MKIIVITDVHANLPALQAALISIHQEGYDLLVHTGDVIAIGPFPAECLDLLLHTPNTQFIMGNHDAYFAYGLPQPQPPWMSDGEVLHQQWTHAQLDRSLRVVVRAWLWQLQVIFDGIAMTFVHYGLDDTGRHFAPIIAQPKPEDLDRLFAAHTTPLLFYGHHHPFADVQGRARYINPGSLGCHTEPLARYAVVEATPHAFVVTHRQVAYADQALQSAFVQRNVPERILLNRFFFGDRFAMP
jgi:predicted phosphodiesterase